MSCIRNQLGACNVNLAQNININMSHPPKWQVYKTEELQMIADLCIKHDVLCISDEVYEWLTYGGAKHVKIGKMHAGILTLHLFV